MSMETIRRTEPMQNDMRHVQMLRQAIFAQIQHGKWD